MKAVVYEGPYDIKVKEVEDPKLEAPTDAIVRIT
jgi:glutathione-independent formaldehyde dehydrogenase